MKNTGNFCAAAVCLMIALPGAHPAFCQSPDQAESTDEARPRWWFVGFQVRGFPNGAIGDGKTERSASNVARSWTYTTTGESPHLGIGPAVEFTLGRRITLRTELLFHRLRYTQTTEIFDGTDNPDTTDTDERKKTTLTERTKATQWDFPLMVRFHGLRDSGVLSRTFVSAGGVLRNVSNIRTGTETTFPDGDTDYNETPVKPSRRNLGGVTIGFGFRLVDEFSIRLTPEIRYTRWFGSTFDLESTRSSKGQLTWGVGLAF